MRRQGAGDGKAQYGLFPPGNVSRTPSAFMRLAASVVAVLLLVLAAFASVGCGAAAATQGVTSAGDGAPGSGICRVAAGDAAKAALAARASEASDAQSDHEDGMEAATAVAGAVGPTAPAAVRAGRPAPFVSSPWLGGLLRPPRALLG